MSWDVIIIGGGHNGLVAATMLAQSGKRVLLAEKTDRPGGLASAVAVGDHELPVVLHDSSGVHMDVVKALKLESHGLRIQRTAVKYAILGQDQHCIFTYEDPRATAESIRSVSQKDADAYLRYRGFLDKIGPFISGLMDEMPPDVTALDNRELFKLGRKAWQLKRLGKPTMLQFLRWAPMSVADVMHEMFETGFLKTGICAPALYGGYVGPWSSGTMLNLIKYECQSRVEVAGGSLAYISALEKAAKSVGVEIRTNAEVQQINISGNKVTGVLINDEVIPCAMIGASSAPRHTILDLVKPMHLTRSFEQDMLNYRTRGTTAILHLALDRPLQFAGVEDTDVRQFRIGGNSIDEMEQSFDAVKYRQFSDSPVLDIRIMGEERKALTIMVHFAPHLPDTGWTDELRTTLKKNVIKVLSKHSDLVGDNIIDYQLLTPLNLEHRFNIPGGNIWHGEYAIDQLITRPMPSCMNYATPITGLYLCGSGNHPGGGLTGMPGYLGAKAMLK